MAEQTTNYNLVKPDPTEFYDVAVQNGNMDAIDTALKGLADNKADGTDLTQLQEEVTKHKDETDGLIKHKANQVSVVAPQGIIATTTQQYLDALFTGYSSKLTDMVDALLLIDPSLPLNQDSTMQDILTVLESGEVGKGKKYVEGVISSSSTSLNVVNGNGTTMTTPAIMFDFSILEFIPSYVIFRPVNKDVNGGFTIWCASNVLDINSGAFKGNVVVGSESSTWLYRQPYVDSVVNIKVGLLSTQHEFLAIE